MFTNKQGINDNTTNSNNSDTVDHKNNTSKRKNLNKKSPIINGDNNTINFHESKKKTSKKKIIKINLIQKIKKIKIQKEIMKITKNRQKLEEDLVTCTACFDLTLELKNMLQEALQESTVRSIDEEFQFAFISFVSKYKSLLKEINCDVTQICEMPDFLSAFIRKIETNKYHFWTCDGHIKTQKTIKFLNEKIEEFKTLKLND